MSELISAGVVYRDIDRILETNGSPQITYNTRGFLGVTQITLAEKDASRAFKVNTDSKIIAFDIATSASLPFLDKLVNRNVFQKIRPWKGSVLLISEIGLENESLHLEIQNSKGAVKVIRDPKVVEEIGLELLSTFDSYLAWESTRHDTELDQALSEREAKIKNEIDRFLDLMEAGDIINIMRHLAKTTSTTFSLGWNIDKTPATKISEADLENREKTSSSLLSQAIKYDINVGLTLRIAFTRDEIIQCSVKDYGYNSALLIGLYGKSNDGSYWVQSKEKRVDIPEVLQSPKDKNSTLYIKASQEMSNEFGQDIRHLFPDSILFRSKKSPTMK